MRGEGDCNRTEACMKLIDITEDVRVLREPSESSFLMTKICVRYVDKL